MIFSDYRALLYFVHVLIDKVIFDADIWVAERTQ